MQAVEYNHDKLNYIFLIQPDLLCCFCCYNSAEKPLDLTTLTHFSYVDEREEEQSVFIIDEMAPQWKRVGRMLRFSEADINVIASNFNDEPQACCDRLLSQWLQGHNDHNDSRPKTWRTLLGVMRDARMGELADRLKRIHEQHF